MKMLYFLSLLKDNLFCLGHTLIYWKTNCSYPLRQAIWSGKEHAPRFMSIFLVRHHLIISRLFNPTTLCKRLYPSSLCICKMFSPRGITLKSPSNRWTVTFGLAHSASKTILIFLLVWSETVRLWLDDSKAWPDWKKLERAPPILIPQQSVVICLFVLHKVCLHICSSYNVHTPIEKIIRGQKFLFALSQQHFVSSQIVFQNFGCYKSQNIVFLNGKSFIVTN